MRVEEEEDRGWRTAKDRRGSSLRLCDAVEALEVKTGGRIVVGAGHSMGLIRQRWCLVTQSELVTTWVEKVVQRPWDAALKVDSSICEDWIVDVACWSCCRC